MGLGGMDRGSNFCKGKEDGGKDMTAQSIPQRCGTDDETSMKNVGNNVLVVYFSKELTWVHRILRSI